MWQKVLLSRNFQWRARFCEMKEKYKVSCVNYFLADIFEMLQASLIVKNNENVVKIGCFEKRLR